MRIGMICPYSLAVWGGVQTQVLGLARSLRRSGVSVQVLAPCDGPPPEPWVTALGNSIPYADNGSLAPLAPDPPAQLRLLGAIWDERFDLLHLHEPMAPGPTLTAVLVKPVPLLGTFHASGDVAGYRWMKWPARRAARRLDLRVAVSSEAEGLARKYLGGDYEVLFNGIEVDRFATAAPLRSKRPTVLFLGRHEPRKGLGVLIEAGRQMPADVRFWIAGTGPQTESLRAATAGDDRFEWLGALSEDEKLARLRGANAFCIPSLGGESFGVVLLEGMAAQVPVVASDIPAYRLVSNNAESASLFTVGDPGALAKALVEALERSAAVERRIDAGIEQAEKFSMDGLASAYVNRYERLVSRRRSAV